jgi:hypothetical protein
MIDIETLVRVRIRHACERLGWSSRAFGRYLEQMTAESWPTPRVSKLLNGSTGLRVNAVAAAAHVLGVSIMDLLSDPTLHTVTDVSENEHRMLRLLRQRDPRVLECIVTILQPPPPPKARPKPRTKKRGRPRKRPLDEPVTLPNK